MGTVIQLKNQINNSYYQLRDSVENRLLLVEEKIKLKLSSDVELVKKMTDYHIDTGGKRLRALLTLGSAKFNPTIPNLLLSCLIAASGCKYSLSAIAPT